MKKILHISKYYPPHVGGIEDVVYGIVNGMNNKYRQQIICFNDGLESIFDCVDGINVLRVGCLFKFASQPVSLSFYFELKKIILTFKPDIIHLHWPNPLASTCLQLCFIPKTIKLVLHWHSDIIEQRNLYFFFRPLETLLLKRADVIIATSRQYLEHSAPLSPYQHKSRVVQNSINEKKLVLDDTDRSLVEALRIRYANKRIVFFLGRHVSYKGIEYLIDGAKYIASDCLVLIAGTGRLTKSLKERAKDNNCIRFLGRLSNKETKCHFHLADVFAFPSITKNEAFGVALAEALYCFTPAVTFNLPESGINWVNKNNHTGFVVLNRNAKDFGSAINRLLNDDALRKEYSENAHAWVKENFTPLQMVRLLTDVYQGLAG